MKLEKITNSKIKIIISLQDIKSNNLSIDDVLSYSDNCQKFIDIIIDKAESELDFCPEQCQLLVEAIVCSSDEYIFTITKINDEFSYSSCSTNTYIFKFDCFDDFTNFCNFFKNFSFLHLKEILKDFSLFFYNNTYYLKFKESKNSSNSSFFITNMLEEFAKIVSPSTDIEGILNEYGKIIYHKNALNKFI